MSDSFQEKTEAPTARRKQDARQKGQVPKSQEMTTAAVLLGAGGLLAMAGPSLVSGLSAVLGEGVQRAGAVPTDIEGVASWVRAVTMQAMLVVAPLLIGLALVSSTITAIQARGVLTTEPLIPDFGRISPLKNASRIWGTRALAELAKSLLKLVVIGFAMYASLRHSWDDVMTLGQQDPLALGRAIGHFGVRLLLTAGGAYLVIAAFDFAYQNWSHEKQLRMTKEEVKRETKEQEGDPQIKARLRSMGRSMIRRQMFKDVAKADVVVTNPTHLAVALKYDPKVSPAPIVLAMGQRKIAERIRKLALEAGVPIIENKPLARALLAAGRIGLPIPAELYVAVAEVLAFVFRRRAASTRAWKGSAVL
jgi:flagellar biosynthesis protein FlhB